MQVNVKQHQIVAMEFFRIVAKMTKSWIKKIMKRKSVIDKEMIKNFQ